MNIFTETKTEEKQQLSTGARVLTDTLTENGVDTVFGYPGTPLLSLYNELANTDKIKHYLSRHEQGSVHAAEGYAKVSGKCGVVITTSGPGFTNTLTGIANANADYTPILVITIQTENIGKNEFQEIDVLEVSKTCAKKVFVTSSPEDIPRVISLGLAEAAKLPKGAVVVGITKSALEKEFVPKKYRLRQDIKVEAHHSCVLKALDTLKHSNNPLIIAGGGCCESERELAEFVSLTQIPVVHTLMGKGVADNISLGLIGSNGDSGLNKIIEKSDVVLALGVRFTDRTTNYLTKFLPNSKIISINAEQNRSKNVKIEKEIIGELKIVLQQMIGAIKSKEILFGINYDWIDRLNESIETSDSDEFNTKNVIDVIYNYTKKYNPIITTDVGEHQILTAKLFKTTSSKNFITSGGFGAMGFGLPAAIGASIAKPNGLVMNITGDGSIQMNLQELATCAQYGLPVKIFIINNSALGMIKTQQLKNSYKVFQSDIVNPDFRKIAESYGILGYTITNMSELKQALTEIFKYKKAVLLDIKV